MSFRCLPSEVEVEVEVEEITEKIEISVMKHRVERCWLIFDQE